MPCRWNGTLRPIANHVITGLDYLITLAVMGAIIGAWPTTAGA